VYATKEVTLGDTTGIGGRQIIPPHASFSLRPPCAVSTIGL
jgi:hypothetical protein